MERLTNYLKKGPLQVFDDMPVAILFTDSDETILHANSACQELFEQSKNTLLGTRYSALMNPRRTATKNHLNDEFLQIRLEIAGQAYNINIHSRSVGEDLILRVIEDITKVLSEVEALHNEIEELRIILKGITGNSRILLMCSVCSKVRLDDGSWIQPVDDSTLLEKVAISHGLCPPCARRYIDETMPEVKGK